MIKMDISMRIILFYPKLSHLVEASILRSMERAQSGYRKTSGSQGQD